MYNRNLSTQVYPFYSIEDLATICGYSNAGTRIILLQKFKIPFDKLGNKYIFYLSDLRTHCPVLADSILECLGLNKLLNNPSAPPTQEENNSPLQFK